MPRIDPLQLLECLQVLLTSDGGILSRNEVHRLAGLMTKFSKKLVSKCIYVLILKKTERSLLDAFMDAGGWTLVQMWLHDATNNQNWPLVVELLELLLVTPVDVARLKSYNIPRMVKGLSKREDLETICKLSNQLVQQWLKIVKDETQYDALNQQTAKPVIVTHPSSTVVVIKTDEDMETDSKDLTISTKTFYEVGTKNSSVEFSDENIKEEIKQESKEKLDEIKVEDKKKNLDKSKHKSSSKSSSRDKERSSSHKSKDRHSSSSSSSREKSHKDKRDKDRHRSNGSVKSSSSTSKSSSSKHKEKDKKETKEKQAEKDKDTLAKIQPQSLQKLPKIPKKSSEEKEKNKDGKEPKSEEVRKGSISVEVRKNNEERPKTVKVYKSKQRLTGLEEEAKPAPPRPVKKPSIVPIIPPPVTLKRSSPPRDIISTPPEKKSKIEVPLEKPGSIKLIPPKPKPPVLQESDMFMDALLTASATTKKEPKKRKRRASVSKDSTPSSPPESPTINSGIKSMAPPKFYQDTLETEESKSDEKGDDKESLDTTIEEEENSPIAASPEKQTEEVECEARVKNINGLRGVLVYVRRKGPKKSIKWKSDDELVDIQYFELDETERVNVTKTFGDMAKMDLRSERELIQMSRKLPNEDVMDVHTVWKVPMEIDLPEPLAVPGCKSLEKDIQFAREKSVLQALYFSKRMLPDAPGEPDLENYQVKDPIMIPIEDAENPDHDFRNTPWPEPKGSPPQISNVPNTPNPVFPNVPQVPFQNFGVGQPPTAFPNLNMQNNMQNNMQPFPSGPQFMQPNVMGGPEWNNGNVGPMSNVGMMHPNMGGPPDMMNQQGPMNPNLFMPPQENFNPMMNDNNHRFPPPFNPQGPGMFPPNNFNMNRGGHGGGFRRGGGNGPWLRMNGPPPGAWNNMRGGGGPHRGGLRLCNNVRNKGFCRNRETCQFFHPNS